MLHRQGLITGDDPLTVDVEPGEGLGVRAGGENDVPTLVAGTSDVDGVGRDQPSLTLDKGDAAGLDQALQPLVEAADNAVLVALTPGMSMPSKETLMPNCELSRAASAISAACSSALVGMHP